jgi:hypothetical protein
VRHRADRRGLAAGIVTAAMLAALILAGSRGLRDYDRALLPYTIGVLLAAFAGAYRTAVWLQRPPTAMYGRRGWQLLWKREGFLARLAFLAGAARGGLFAQRFIRRRGTGRWAAHFALAWGSLLAAAVTFPLVFGWLHFETRPDDARWYRVVVLGGVVSEFHTASLTRHLLFNLLNLSAILVTAGALLALRRRLRAPALRAHQSFGADIVPLLLLIAISVSGLLLTLSAQAFGGAGYATLSLAHALVVTGTLVYIPFGKLFHIVQRPAQLAVALHRRADVVPAVCGSCGEPYAGALQVADLERVLAEVDLDFRLPGPVAHYARVCPRCRRRLFGFSQGLLLPRPGVV